MKYNIQFGIGKVKYVINFFNGEKRHKDGSEFWDIMTFRNKKKLNSFIISLEEKGYKYGY